MKTYTYHLLGGVAQFDPSPDGPMAKGVGFSEMTADLLDVHFTSGPDAFAASLEQTFGIQVDRHMIAEASAAGSTTALLLRPVGAGRTDFSAYHLWMVPGRSTALTSITGLSGSPSTQH